MSGEIPILNYGGSAGSYPQDNNRSMSGNYPSNPYDRNSQIASAGERYPNPNQGSGIGSAGNQGYGRGPYEPQIGTGVRPEYASGQEGFGSNTRMPDNPSYSDRSGGIGSRTQYNPPYPGSGMEQGGIGSGARPDYGPSYPSSGQGGIGSGARSDYGPNYPNSGYGQGGYGSDTRPGYNPSSNYPSSGYGQGGIGMGARPAEAPPYRDVGFSQPSYGRNQGPPPLSRDPRMKPDEETRVYDPYADCALYFTLFEIPLFTIL